MMFRHYTHPKWHVFWRKLTCTYTNKRMLKYYAVTSLHDFCICTKQRDVKGRVCVISDPEDKGICHSLEALKGLTLDLDYIRT